MSFLTPDEKAAGELALNQLPEPTQAGGLYIQIAPAYALDGIHIIQRHVYESEAGVGYFNIVQREKANNNWIMAIHEGDDTYRNVDNQVWKNKGGGGGPTPPPVANPPIVQSMIVEDANPDTIIVTATKTLTGSSFLTGFSMTRNNVGSPLITGTLQDSEDIFHLVAGAQPRAFPGAQGFGSTTRGAWGLSGTPPVLIRVTNTNDSGAGSLRAALTTSGPRVIVPVTGGTITGASDIVVTDPYFTFLGQTAPGGGLCFKGYSIYISTHDFIIRYLRVRPGLGGSGYANAWYPSCITITTQFATGDVYNGIIDHCSLSWATNEAIDTWIPSSSAYKVYNITVSRSIITESLEDTTHFYTPHSDGPYLGVRRSQSLFSHNISFHHNLISHMAQFAMRVDGAQQVEIINNIFHHWGATPLDFTNICSAHVINNYFKQLTGVGANYEISLQSTIGQTAQVYVSGNKTSDPDYNAGNIIDARTNDPSTHGFASDLVFTASGITTATAAAAYTDILSDVGANLPAIDSADSRIITAVTNRTGAFIDNPTDVGGYPTLAAGTYGTDTDSDGMTDAYEDANGLNKNSAADALNTDVSFYSEIEVYANSISGDTESADFSYNDDIKVSYDATEGDITDQDTPAQVLASFDDFDVDNRISVPVGIPPAFIGAEIGQNATTKVVVTYNALIVSPTNNYLTGHVVKKNGSAVTISSAARGANQAKIELTLSVAGVYTDIFTYGYAGGNITSQDGIPMETITEKLVTNNIPGVPPLQYVTSEIGTVSSSVIAVTFNRAIQATNYLTGNTVKKNGVATTISSANRSSFDQSVLELNLATAGVATDTFTYEYAGGNITDQSTPPVALGTVTSKTVVNNIAVPAGPRLLTAVINSNAPERIVATYSEALFETNSNYANGHFIKKSSINQPFIGATRQSPQTHILHFQLSANASAGESYTLSYSRPPGNITSLPGSTGTYDVMLLGDSITEGNWQGGWRAQLYNILTLGGFDFDFVGTNESLHDDSGLSFDFPSSAWQHEGRNSANINIVGASTWIWANNIVAKLTANPPDVMTVMLGTNDCNALFYYGTVSTIITAMSNFLEQIWTFDSTIRVFLITPPKPRSDAPYYNNVVNYVALLPALVAQKQANGRPISLIDIYSVLNNSSGSGGDLEDQTHPSVQGHLKIAQTVAPYFLSLQTGVVTPMASFSDTAVTNNLTSPSLPSSDFVTVNGTEFWRDDGPFYPFGSNLYQLQQAFANNLPAWSTASLDANQARGSTCIRTWAFSERHNFSDGNPDSSYMRDRQGGQWVYTEANIVALDRAIFEIKKRNMVAIPCLTNNWTQYGGMPQIALWAGTNKNGAWTNATAKQYYKDWVSYILNRTNTYTNVKYKDEPAIMAWQLCNEARNESNQAGTTLRDWYVEMAAYVKSIDSNHLVCTGEEGLGNEANGTGGWSTYLNDDAVVGFGSGSSYKLNVAATGIDFGCFHNYLFVWFKLSAPILSSANVAVETRKWISDHVTLAAAQNKPTIMDEWGSQDAVWNDSTANRQYYQQWYGYMLESYGGDYLAGAMMWQLIKAPQIRTNPGEIRDGDNATENNLAAQFQQCALSFAAKNQPGSGPGDITEPSVNITSPADGATVNTTSVTVQGTANDNIAVTLVRGRVNGGSWTTATGTTSWSVGLTLTVTDGNNLIEIQGQDAAANSSIDSITLAHSSAAASGQLDFSDEDNGAHIPATIIRM